MREWGVSILGYVWSLANRVYEMVAGPDVIGFVLPTIVMVGLTGYLASRATQRG